jgi:threonine/homoserine/homoserine lactone efflux protein
VSLDDWLGFVIASLIVLMIPGPTVLMVTSYSIAYGRRVNPFLVGAVALGDCAAICVSLLGLGSLLSASPFWFGAVRCAGALYLAYMGVSLFRRSSAVFPSAAHVRSRWRIFWSTFVLTAANPKGLVFYVAFLPQFVDADRGTTVQLSVLAVNLRRTLDVECDAVRDARFVHAAHAGLGLRPTPLSPHRRISSRRHRHMGTERRRLN